MIFFYYLLFSFLSFLCVFSRKNGGWSERQRLKSIKWHGVAAVEAVQMQNQVRLVPFRWQNQVAARGV